MQRIPSRAPARILAMVAAAALLIQVAPTDALAAQIDPYPASDFAVKAAWTDGSGTDYVLVKDADGYRRFSSSTWASANLSMACADGNCPEMNIGQISSDGILPIWEGSNLSTYNLIDNAPVPDSSVALPTGAKSISANSKLAVYQGIDGLWYAQSFGEAATELLPDSNRTLAVAGAEAGTPSYFPGAAVVSATTTPADDSSPGSLDVETVAGSERQQTMSYQLGDVTLRDGSIEPGPTQIKEVRVVGNLVLAIMATSAAEQVNACVKDLYSEVSHSCIAVSANAELTLAASGLAVYDSAAESPLQWFAFPLGVNSRLIGEAVAVDIDGYASFGFLPAQGGANPVGSFTDADGVAGLVKLNTDGTLTDLTKLAIVPSSVTISGNPVVGQTLTAEVAAWKPANTELTYQWYADEVAISQASAASLVLTEDQLGAAITVKVSGTRVGYLPAEQVSAATALVTKVVAVTGAVQISGSPAVGQRLTARVSGWPAGTTFTYQWLRNGAAIGGARGLSYRVVAADGGAELSVRLTANVAGTDPITVTSEVVKIASRTLSSTPRPVILGSARVGGYLLAYPGLWRPAPVKLSYQWYRDGKAIIGATRITYRLARADRNTVITVAVTGSKAGYDSVTKVSKATKTVR